MMDEHFDRHYQQARSDLNGAVLRIARRLADAFGDVFVVLNHIEYSAPWKTDSGQARTR